MTDFKDIYDIEFEIDNATVSRQGFISSDIVL